MLSFFFLNKTPQEIDHACKSETSEKLGTTDLLFPIQPSSHPARPPSLPHCPFACPQLKPHPNPARLSSMLPIPLPPSPPPQQAWRHRPSIRCSFADRTGHCSPLGRHAASRAYMSTSTLAGWRPSFDLFQAVTTYMQPGHAPACLPSCKDHLSIWASRACAIPPSPASSSSPGPASI